jgi:hypothetical protein
VAALNDCLAFLTLEEIPGDAAADQASRALRISVKKPARQISIKVARMKLHYAAFEIRELLSHKKFLFFRFRRQ